MHTLTYGTASYHSPFWNLLKHYCCSFFYGKIHFEKVHHNLWVRNWNLPQTRLILALEEEKEEPWPEDFLLLFFALFFFIACSRYLLLYNLVTSSVFSYNTSDIRGDSDVTYVVSVLSENSIRTNKIVISKMNDECLEGFFSFLLTFKSFNSWYTVSFCKYFLSLINS